MLLSTIQRMQQAEERLLTYMPKTYRKVKELKSNFKSVYALDEDQFTHVTRLALALNVRDGYCQDIKERQQYESKK